MQLPLLESERLYLRKVQLSDVNENYFNWMNDDEVTRFLESRFSDNTMENLLEYVKLMDQDKQTYFLAIILKSTQRHIGNIKLGPINTIHKFAEIGIIVGEKDCWGKGYASEAIQMLTEFAFSKLKLNKLTAGCYQPNGGSLKAFEKAGFIIEGFCKQQYYQEGKFIDGIRFGLLNHKTVDAK